MQEAHDLFEQVDVVVSIGTGRTSRRSVFGLIHEFFNVIDHALSSETTHQISERYCNQHNIEYFRFNPGYSKKVKLDASDRNTIDFINVETNDFLRRNDVQIPLHKLCNMLVEDDRPTVKNINQCYKNEEETVKSEPEETLISPWKQTLRTIIKSRIAIIILIVVAVAGVIYITKTLYFLL